MPYGIRLLEILLKEGKQVYLLYSKVAQIVAQQEMSLALPSSAKEAESFLVVSIRCRMDSCVYSDARSGLRRLLPDLIRPTRW